MPTWKQIRELTDNPFSRGMYFWVFFVPIVAKSLALVESPLNIKIFGASLNVQLELPFSWVAFFSAALLFAMVNLLYQIFAPQIIKDHPDFKHFDESGKKHDQLADYYLDALESYSGNKDVESLFDRDKADVRNTFWELMYRANHQTPKLRWLSMYLYGCGAALLALVLIQNIVYVYSFL